MKKLLLLSLLSVLVLGSCVNREKDLYDPDAVEAAKQAADDEAIRDNAANYFTGIDPNQDWCPVVSGSVEVTADADLDDIVKVQILTESPFFNVDARVLNEVAAKKGQTVWLCYDAPAVYTRLIAACVDSKGVYYIKGFDVGEQSVSFADEEASSRRAGMARASVAMPALADLKLEVKNMKQSFNALRTIRANAAAASDDEAEKAWVKAKHIDLWEGAGWEQERVWKVSKNSSASSDWLIGDGFVCRDIEPIGETERKLLADVYNTSLFKTDGRNKRNNLETLRNNPNFKLEQNYLTCDGVNPITVIPVQTNSTEIGRDYLYYYYFNPAELEGKSDEEQAGYLKSLPKYLAVDGGHARKQANKYSTDLAAFTKCQEYLLPYYGDGEPADGQTAVGAVIPRGYKVGFLIRKLVNNDIDNVSNGCTYGDGRLNREINRFPGHFGSAMTAYSMREDDGRNVLFRLNGSTYISFEDGADCNFCDLVIEVKGATALDTPQEPEAEVYTMCFEDRPAQADYDLNDVVLSATRQDATHIEVSVVACGAVDRVTLHGIMGSKRLEGREIHEIFGLGSGQSFANTEIDGLRKEAVSEVIEVEPSVRIEDVLKAVYIKNETTGKTIKMPRSGEAPYVVIVPELFQYPLEHLCIIDAYPDFEEWAQDANAHKDWYLSGQSGKVYIR